MKSETDTNRETTMTAQTQRDRTAGRVAAIMADARAMAEHSGIREDLMMLWFGGHLANAGTLEHARDVRRACATACLIAGRGYPSHMDAHTMAGLVGL